MNRNAIEQRRRASWNIQTAFHLGHITPVIERDRYEGIPKSRPWTNASDKLEILIERLRRDQVITQRQKAGEQIRREWTPGSWV